RSGAKVVYETDGSTRQRQLQRTPALPRCSRRAHLAPASPRPSTGADRSRRQASGSGAWIRTMIQGFKVPCPAFRRRRSRRPSLANPCPRQHLGQHGAGGGLPLPDAVVNSAPIVWLLADLTPLQLRDLLPQAAEARRMPHQRLRVRPDVAMNSGKPLAPERAHHAGELGPYPLDELRVRGVFDQIGLPRAADERSQQHLIGGGPAVPFAGHPGGGQNAALTRGDDEAGAAERVDRKSTRLNSS